MSKVQSPFPRSRSPKYKTATTAQVRKQFEGCARDIENLVIPKIVGELETLVRLIQRTIVLIEECQAGEEFPEPGQRRMTKWELAKIVAAGKRAKRKPR